MGGLRSWFTLRRTLVIGGASALMASLLPVIFRKKESQMSQNGNEKKILEVIGPREEHWVGDGFYVSSIFSVNPAVYKYITPFLLLDHAAPKNFPPTEKKLGVGEHPHRGFETVTFAIKGEVEHRDSGGGGGTITTGGVQWMTAASGVVHEEFHSREFARTGGEFEMIQLWVNLPKKDKMTTPRYQSIEAKDCPVVELESGVSAKIIAGELKGGHGPAKTFTPINIVEIDFNENKPVSLELPDNYTTLVFQVKGTGKVQDKELKEREIAIFDRPGSSVKLTGDVGAKYLVLNGEPIDEPVASYGPFVMNTPDEIQQAIVDYQSGKMGSLVKESGGS